MTSGTALLADPAARLHACLDEMSGLDFDQWSTQRHAAFEQSMTRLEARVAALRMSNLAAADRSRAAARSGAASTSQWAAQLSNADQAAACRDVALAQGLARRTATQQALTQGTISAEHAAVIVQSDRNLPPQVSAAQRAQIESALVHRAQTLAPAALRREARRALAEVEADINVVDAHENALVASEEETARARTRLTLHDNQDGTVTGHFTVPTAQGHLLRKILQTITAPRRGRLGAALAQIGDNSGLRTDWDRARGEAFCEVLEHLPTDHLHPRTAATLVVTITEETLRDALKVAHLDTGANLSAGEARRLACTARILPAVLGGASLPLDLGRSARLFSEAQRTALGLKHSTCGADGCERPFAWCELHHRDQWARGGKTDLANAIPLCHFHHRRIHDDTYVHRTTAAGQIIFARRT